MAVTTWRRLLTVAVATAGLAAVPVAASAAPNALPGGSVMIQNGAFTDYVLCASADNSSVWLKTKASAAGNAYCAWMQFGGDGQFTLFNVGKSQVLACTGGDVGPVVVEQPGTSGLGSNAEQFSWGGTESWGSRALQCYYDSGQNVDAKASDGDYPRTDPVRARGWRHGYQRELTWNEVVAS